MGKPTTSWEPMARRSPRYNDQRPTRGRGGCNMAPGPRSCCPLALERCLLLVSLRDQAQGESLGHNDLCRRNKTSVGQSELWTSVGRLWRSPSPTIRNEDSSTTYCVACKAELRSSTTECCRVLQTRSVFNWRAPVPPRRSGCAARSPHAAPPSAEPTTATSRGSCAGGGLARAPTQRCAAKSKPSRHHSK